MYNFDQDLVDRAIQFYTRQHCYGELDAEFYMETWYTCYGNAALEACITMDYIDEVCKEIYDEVCEGFPKRFRKYKRTLDGGYPMGC